MNPVSEPPVPERKRRLRRATSLRLRALTAGLAAATAFGTYAAGEAFDPVRLEFVCR